MQRFADALAEVRSAPLPFVLLSFNYGAYLLAGLIASCSQGGISENEEWRIFIAGWLFIPPVSPTVALLIAYLKRARYADIESFYPLLLATNALFWVAYFAYHFPPPWLYEYEIGPQALSPLVWLLPLVNLLALLALNRREFPFARRNATGIYALLPLTALYVGINFSGFQIDRPELTAKTWWPVINPLEENTDSVNYDITAGEKFYSTQGPLLNLDMISKISATLHIPLPWPLSTGSRLTAWHVEEGERIEPNRVFVEFESEFLRTQISARAPIQLKTKGYQLGEEAESNRTLLSYIPLSNGPQPNPWFLYSALALGLVALFASRLKTMPPLPIPPIAIDLAVILATFLLAFDSAYVFDPHHYNFFLGPINDVLRGKTLLVDINCQYGVGIIYFLALLFKLLPIPLNYQGFSLFLNTLLIFQYALVYLLMRRILNSQFFAITALLLIIAAGYYSQLGATLPSTGPLRFGLAYVLLAVFAIRARIGPQPQVQIALYALIGFSSLWSFESFTYVLATYLCTELYALLWNPRELQYKLHRLLPLIGGPAISIAIGHLLLAIFTYLRAGTWPEWSHYFDYLALYSVDEFGTTTIEAWRPWALYIAVYFLSLLLLLHKALFAPSADATPFAFIAGLTGFGIAQFTYFLGRSHHNNLYHICIPLVFIATYWFLHLQRDSRHVPRVFARSVTYCFFVAVFVLLAKAGPEFIAKWPRSPLHSLLHTAPAGPTPWSTGTSHTEVSDALALIERYAADIERVALFLDAERTTETLMLSQKTHIFPLSNPKQDDLLPSAHARALQYDHGMQEGDYLFITRDTPSLTHIQHAVLSELLDQMRGLPVDSTEYVYAIRLSASHPKGQP